MMGLTNYKKMGNWISVKDRLPELNELVLIYAGKYIHQQKINVASLNQCNDYRHDGNNYPYLRWANPPMYYDSKEVTHWMPLPAEPID